MENDLRKQIYNNLNLRETEDLLEIWQKRNLDEWREEVFDIIEQILMERLGYVPPQTIRADDHQVPVREVRRINPKSQEAWDYPKSTEQGTEEDFLKSSTKFHLDQALAYALNDEPERALEECGLARNAMPEIAIAYNYLGLILEQLGQVEPAIEAYLKAIQLKPRFNAARENLANARLKLEAEQYRQASLQNRDGTNGEDSSPDDKEDIPWDFDETEDTKIPGNGDPAPGWIYLDEKSFLLAGWPGHRIRPGRTGYDPLDTDFEAAHIEGVIIRLLFTRRFRTHHPVYLFVMAYLCILFCLPLFFLWGINSQNYLASMLLLIYYSPIWILGIALLINIFSSLLTKKPDASEDNGSAFF